MILHSYYKHLFMSIFAILSSLTSIQAYANLSDNNACENATITIQNNTGYTLYYYVELIGGDLTNGPAYGSAANPLTLKTEPLQWSAPDNYSEGKIYLTDQLNGSNTTYNAYAHYFFNNLNVSCNTMTSNGQSAGQLNVQLTSNENHQEVFTITPQGPPLD